MKNTKQIIEEIQSLQSSITLKSNAKDLRQKLNVLWEQYRKQVKKEFGVNVGDLSRHKGKSLNELLEISNKLKKLA